MSRPQKPLRTIFAGSGKWEAELDRSGVQALAHGGVVRMRALERLEVPGALAVGGVELGVRPLELLDLRPVLFGRVARHPLT